MSPSGVSSIFLLVVLMYMPGTSNAGYAEDCDATYPAQWCNMDGNTWHVLDDKRCVKAFAQELRFDSAMRICAAIDGVLVSLHNLEQNDRMLCYLFRLNKGHRRQYWIGARLGSGGFFWIDRTGYMTFSRWEAHQPDNFFWHEECAEFNYADWGLWNDAYCYHYKPFICARFK